MVARGDLGVEIPLEQVPLVQKRAVRLARAATKPVIVATQMLESMITHSRPTRAEASDVANAVLDGADALMLSGETSVGAHPIETVDTMARIIKAAEAQALASIAGVSRRRDSRGDAIAAAAVRIAEDIEACALVAFTSTGATARGVSAHRDPIPAARVHLRPRGAQPARAAVGRRDVRGAVRGSNTEDMVHQVDRAMLELGRGKPGDQVVVVASTQRGHSGSTNTIRVHRLGVVGARRRGARPDPSAPRASAPSSACRTRCSSSSERKGLRIIAARDRSPSSPSSARPG